jgi:hypothetical protein
MSGAAVGALRRFNEMWSHPGYPPERVDPTELTAAEARLGRRLPEAYVRAVTEVGLPRPTLSLLTSLDEADLDIRDVSDFFAPAELVERFDDFRSEETPDDFFPFANTSTGDRFGFLAPRSAGRAADAPVVLMDHETGEVEEIADSFVDWLLDFNDVEFVHFDDA